jgi:hypothetical protein
MGAGAGAGAGPREGERERLPRAAASTTFLRLDQLSLYRLPRLSKCTNKFICAVQVARREVDSLRANKYIFRT